MAGKVFLKDRWFEPYIDTENIRRRVSAMGAEISAAYGDTEQPLCVLGVLNGAFIFLADLVRGIDLPTEIYLVRASSYDGMASTGRVQIDLEGSPDLGGRDVLIVEDIVDSGLTMKHLIREIADRGAASVRIAALLVKPEALIEEITVDWTGFEIPVVFVVGYGLDYDGLGRQLPAIYRVA